MRTSLPRERQPRLQQTGAKAPRAVSSAPVGFRDLAHEVTGVGRAVEDGLVALGHLFNEGVDARGAVQTREHELERVAERRASRACGRGPAGLRFAVKREAEQCRLVEAALRELC